MTATTDNAAPDPQQIIAELQRKLDESRAELAARNSAYTERIAYQAAANDVLKVMSASPGDPQPVFDLIVERARTSAAGTARRCTNSTARLSIGARRRVSATTLRHAE